MRFFDMATQKFFLALLSIFFSFSAISISYATRPTGDNQQRLSMMKIRIDIEGSKQPLFATLPMTPTVQDFAKQLPLTLTLKDYDSTEKIADLPTKLTTQNAPNGYAGKAGDLTYYAPWGNLAFSIKTQLLGTQMVLFCLGNLRLFPKSSSKNNPSKFQFPK